MEFQAFSLLHLFAIALIAGSTTLAIVRGRRNGPFVSPSKRERGIGFLFTLVWVATHIALVVSPEFNPLKSLPLQMCHWVALIAGLSLFTGWRPFSILVYFWGLALCTQALITPTLLEGPTRYAFWYFWLSHGMIVGVAAYDILVRNFRPQWRDYRFALLIAVLYFAVVMPINLLLGANYGFLGESKPDQLTLIDALGPWPQRLLYIIALVAAAMAVMMLPWAIGRWLLKKRQGMTTAAD